MARHNPADKTPRLARESYRRGDQDEVQSLRVAAALLFVADLDPFRVCGYLQHRRLVHQRQRDLFFPDRGVPLLPPISHRNHHQCALHRNPENTAELALELKEGRGKPCLSSLTL